MRERERERRLAENGERDWRLVEIERERLALSRKWRERDWHLAENGEREREIGA